MHTQLLLALVALVEQLHMLTVVTPCSVLLLLPVAAKVECKVFQAVMVVQAAVLKAIFQPCLEQAIHRQHLQVKVIMAVLAQEL
jgi:hypothetical protein